MNARSARRLTLDLGNRSAKLRLFEGARLAGAWRRFAAGPWPVIEPPDELLGVRVPGRDVRDLPEGWPAVRWVGIDFPLPGEVLYDRPEEMGADRRLTAWAAGRFFGPCLVLDCGTAVTLTWADGEDRIAGLAIAPGLRTLAEGLAAAAPALARHLEPDAEPGPGLPRGSRDNLAVGLRVGYAGMLRALVADAAARLGLEPALCLTGSDAALAMAALDRGRLVPDLVHHALLLCAGVETCPGSSS
ncbi:MAG: type III pantothenate kinase [Planctomycetota bacterium]